MSRRTSPSSRPGAGRWLRPSAWWVGVAVAPAAAFVIARAVDVDALRTVVDSMRASPTAVVVVTAVYAGAFALRAVAWSRTLPSLRLRDAVAALHVAVGANHVLPLRMGEVLRVTSVVRRTDVGTAAAVASTVTLRAADVLVIGALAAVLGPSLLFDVLGAGGPLLLVAALVAVVAGSWWAVRHRHGGQLRPPGPVTLGLVVVAWTLEGVVMHQAAAWAGVPITPAEAILVTAVTIAAQVLAVAPGGFGTYEAAATAVLVGVGVPADTALAVAVTAHALKTVYALVTGAVATVWPRPSLLGRFRLTGPSGGGLDADQPGVRVPVHERHPVVLFLPAHNEEASVAAVVRRVPPRIGSHPVQCLVIDDGSTDDTAERAREAGAEVVPTDPERGRNLGLGAAVRRGLDEGVRRGAAVVAFCDADGEYAPEELGRLVDPILGGSADYVVGSRFAGTIDHMLPHRRVGNSVLTRALRYVARTPVTDGQSGYRALSGRAAAEARVVHDFNYAQVLTLDLLARGARYTEVPITYRFRTHGRSFVRLAPYLAAVLPAIHRQLNTEVPRLGHGAAAADGAPVDGRLVDGG